MASTKTANYYAQRLFQQAVLDPNVDALDSEAVEAYIREECDKLYLDDDMIIRSLERDNMNPMTTDFIKAAQLQKS